MRKLMLLFIAMALVVTACGDEDGDTPGAEGRDLDRCSLMTVEEAAQWLGDPVTAAPSEDLDGSPSPVTCLYEGANASVLLQVRDGAVYFAEPGSASRTGEDVDGIGEDAFMDSDSIEVLQNDWSVAIGLITGLVEDDALLGMAEIVSDRLP
jgi:hypothetical protein